MTLPKEAIEAIKAIISDGFEQVQSLDHMAERIYTAAAPRIRRAALEEDAQDMRRAIAREEQRRRIEEPSDD